MLILAELTWLIAEGDNNGGLNPWFLVLVFGALALMLILPRLSRRSKILDDPRQKRTAQVELRHSMDRLLVELQETAREINAAIDTKLITLNRLIEEADRKIETLRKLASSLDEMCTRAERAPGRPKGEPVGPAEEEPTTEEARRRRELEREICRLADEGKTELEIARLTDTARGEVELVLSMRRMPDQGK